MSANRGNAVAVQRRTNGPPPPPPGGSRPQQGGQQNVRQINRGASSQQGQGQKQGRPQMSVSDAIGLLSLRMGRIETFVQQLPPLDQIGVSGGSVGSGEIGENMRVVDEAVFTSIVSRLDRLEKNHQNQQNHTNDSDDQGQSQETEQLAQTVSALLEEVAQMKVMLISLQNFTMQTNQRLLGLVLNGNQGHEEGDDTNNAQVEGETEDNEILSDNIDLKAYVSSAL